MLSFLISMKVKEKAWFNLCNEEVFKVKDQQFEDAGNIDDEDDDEGLAEEFEAISGGNKSGRTGTHFEIIVLRLEYKNDETFEGKKLVRIQKKEEGRYHFLKKEYSEALRTYKFLVDILSNCSKKLYT